MVIATTDQPASHLAHDGQPLLQIERHRLIIEMWTLCHQETQTVATDATEASASYLAHNGHSRFRHRNQIQTDSPHLPHNGQLLLQDERRCLHVAVLKPLDVRHCGRRRLLPLLLLVLPLLLKVQSCKAGWCRGHTKCAAPFSCRRLQGKDGVMNAAVDGLYTTAPVAYKGHRHHYGSFSVAGADGGCQPLGLLKGRRMDSSPTIIP